MLLSGCFLHVILELIDSDLRTWCCSAGEAFQRIFSFHLPCFSAVAFLFYSSHFCSVYPCVLLVVHSIVSLSFLSILRIYTLNSISQRLLEGLVMIGPSGFQSSPTRCGGLLCCFTTVFYGLKTVTDSLSLPGCLRGVCADEILSCGCLSLGLLDL